MLRSRAMRRTAERATSLKMQQQQRPADLSADKLGDIGQEGSVIGAALLFAGTAVGAGMLALPAETAAAGFLPSELSLLMCWLFTFTTSLVTLEASWFVGQDKDRFPEGAAFLSMCECRA